MSQSPPAPPRALLIDDESAIRMALRRFLTRQGWAVDEAGDGERALRLLLDVEEDRYAAVLCDLRLPEVSGLELYRRLRTERPEVLPRLVFSTGDVHSADAVEIAEGTECPVIEKPFDLVGMYQLLERVAGR